MPSVSASAMTRFRKLRVTAAPIEPVVAQLVAEHARRPGHPVQDAVGVRVGRDPDLAHGLHALDQRCQLVEDVERVLGAGHADALAHPVGEARHMDVLAPDDARRIAVQEPDQADVVVRGSGDDILDGVAGHLGDLAQGRLVNTSVSPGSVAWTTHRMSSFGYRYRSSLSGVSAASLMTVTSLPPICACVCEAGV